MVIQLQRDGGGLVEELQLLDGRRVNTKRGVPFTLPADLDADYVFSFVADGARRFKVVGDTALQGRVDAEHERQDDAAQAQLDADEAKRADRVAARAASIARLEEAADARAIAAEEAAAQVEPEA